MTRFVLVIAMVLFTAPTALANLRPPPGPIGKPPDWLVAAVAGAAVGAAAVLAGMLLRRSHCPTKRQV
ncbi:MAG: hypothetical protein K8U57_07575 [Planctomycetes bacterium]|nr:hypothetical protein [Planctomycetota bacterium]